MTNMDMILLFLAKPLDKHGITLVHITYPPLRNQKNENSENSKAGNEGYFHWLKTGGDDILSNFSKPTGSLFTTKSAKPSSFEAEGFEAFEICRFPRDAQRNTFSMSAKNRRGRKMYRKNTP